MKIFDYDNYNLVLNKYEILLVKEFAEVWESDKSKDKRKAFEMFKYAFLMCDFMSPYREYEDTDEKIAEAKKDCNLNEPTYESDLMKNLLLKYEEIMNSNRVIRTINSMMGSVDKLNKYFETIDFTVKVESGARKGTLLHDPKQLLDVIARAGSLVETIKELKKQAIEEMAKPVEIRGSDEAVGYFAEQAAKKIN